MTFTVDIIINKPVDIVTAALMNPGNFPCWQKDLEEFEVVKGKPGEVGSIGHLHYKQKGQVYIMEDKLIYCEPGKKYVSQVSGGLIDAQLETTLDSLGDDTIMNMKWSGKGKVFFLKILLPLLRSSMIKQSQMELDTFKRLVETKGSVFI